MVVPAVADLSAPKVAVIGCGNPNRRDDGVGPKVIAALRSLPLPEYVALFDAGTDGMGVMYRARGAKRLIIVDARAPAGAPGALYEAPGAALESTPPQSLTLHDFRWDHALYAGRKIYRDDFPADVTVVLIEAASLEFGLELTPDVAAALPKAAQRVAEIAAAPLAADRAADHIDVRAGSVYLSAATSERYFKGATTVAMMLREGVLHVYPVRQAEFGGCLLKIRNAAGDRVASAPDMFAANGLGDFVGLGLKASWSDEAGALRARLSPLSAN